MKESEIGYQALFKDEGTAILTVAVRFFLVRRLNHDSGLWMGQIAVDGDGLGIH